MEQARDAFSSVATVGQMLNPTLRLTLEGVRKAIAAAEAYAKEHNAPESAIAVVGDGGNLIARFATGFSENKLTALISGSQD